MEALTFIMNAAAVLAFVVGIIAVVNAIRLYDARHHGNHAVSDDSRAQRYP